MMRVLRVLSGSGCKVYLEGGWGEWTVVVELVVNVANRVGWD